MSKIHKSWEDEYRHGEIHSPRGIARLRETVRNGLRRQYYNIAMTMFRWEGIDAGRFEEMSVASMDTLPERWLLENGTCCWFELGDGSIHCLPWVMEGGLNMYGKPNQWRVIPVGWNTSDERSNPAAFRELYNTIHTHEDSVLMMGDLEQGSPKAFIDAMVDMLVDNVATINQLQLLVKMPFIFNVTQDNLLTAKNFFLAVCDDRPAIFQNVTGEAPIPQVEQLNVAIDPALFEIADRIECYIMTYLGIPCVPITKRAQQSVAEVESNGDEIDLRRRGMLAMREKAVDRINAKWGTDLRVVSVLDEVMENEATMGRDTPDSEDGSQEDPGQGAEEGGA